MQVLANIFMHIVLDSFYWGEGKHRRRQQYQSVLMQPGVHGITDVCVCVYSAAGSS